MNGKLIGKCALAKTFGRSDEHASGCALNPVHQVSSSNERSAAGHDSYSLGGRVKGASTPNGLHQSIVTIRGFPTLNMFG